MRPGTTRRYIRTPTNISPLTQNSSTKTSLSQDSWQSRLSSPICSLTKDVPQALHELHNLPPYEEFDFMNNPRLHLLLKIESQSFLTNDTWLRNNRLFDIDQEIFEEIRQILRPFADELDETAFVATMILRQVASRKRICNGTSRYAYTVAAAFLAGKLCEENDPKLTELINEAGLSEYITVQQIIAAERRMACELNWNFMFASPTELGFSLLDCLEGLKPSVKAALMQIVGPVCYDYVFNSLLSSKKPSYLVASIFTCIFTVLFKTESQRSKWAQLFSQLVESDMTDILKTSYFFDTSIGAQLTKVMKKNNLQNKI